MGFSTRVGSSATNDVCSSPQTLVSTVSPILENCSAVHSDDTAGYLISRNPTALDLIPNWRISTRYPRQIVECASDSTAKSRRHLSLPILPTQQAVAVGNLRGMRASRSSADIGCRDYFAR